MAAVSHRRISHSRNLRHHGRNTTPGMGCYCRSTFRCSLRRRQRSSCQLSSRPLQNWSRMQRHRGKRAGVSRSLVVPTSAPCSHRANVLASRWRAGRDEASNVTLRLPARQEVVTRWAGLVVEAVARRRERHATHRPSNAAIPCHGRARGYSLIAAFRDAAWLWYPVAVYRTTAIGGTTGATPPRECVASAARRAARRSGARSSGRGA
jgi:hypothetical protein